MNDNANQIYFQVYFQVVNSISFQLSSWNIFLYFDLLSCYKRQKKQSHIYKKQEVKPNRSSDMSTKSQDKKKNKDWARRWRKEEIEKFAEILSEPSNKGLSTKIFHHT